MAGVNDSIEQRGEQRFQPHMWSDLSSDLRPSVKTLQDAEQFSFGRIMRRVARRVFRPTTAPVY